MIRGRAARLAPWLLGAGLAINFGAGAASATAHQPIHAPAEEQLIDALQYWHSGHYGTALHELGALVDVHPDFRLAQFLYGEALLGRAGNARAIRSLEAGEQGRRSALIDEARLRWRHYRHAPPAGAVPNAVLLLAPRYLYVIAVDLEHNRLYLFTNQNKSLRLIADFYASVGAAGGGKQFEGDLRTPVGIYHVTGFKPDRTLPELYGDGAFPLNYPNAWDQFFGRTGDGIWLHGVPRTTYNRPPRASEGCVVLSNRDLRVLGSYIRPGTTPVVLSNHLDWVSRQDTQLARHDFLRRLQAWQQSWEQVASTAYLGFYAENFVSVQGQSKYEFSRFARTVSLGDTQRMALRLDDVSVFQYPGEPHLMLVSFTRRVGEEQTGTGIRQYWRKSPQAGWQIVLEKRFQPTTVAANVLFGDR
ncbi:MAG: L,D-transpeptidase [Salinisphaera sp.]|nr:L,D-transpeptidase [Salinisphaera sp.]